ncbi:MAG: GNAT family N-acetyltransferase [Clostridia bacterium]|nr:GNAT family N-acetyltransferase [Clostridia bacterium]
MLNLLNQNYMPPIETQRLLLRKLTLDDAEDLYEYSREERVAKYVLWRAHESIADTKFFLRCVQRQYRQYDKTAPYGITLKDSGKVIGTISFSYVAGDRSSAEIGYSLSHDYWNMGYMTEALKAVIDYSFKELYIHRIEAVHDVRNIASGHVMRKCGMKLEGTMRDKLINKGEYITVNMYAIINPND